MIRQCNSILRGKLTVKPRDYLPGVGSFAVTVLLALLCVSIAHSEVRPPPYITKQANLENLIRVGVRQDADPFSYLKSSRVDNLILPRYSGYILEICRTVLRQMVAGEIFQGYRIKAVPVSAADRFEKLANREVDLLCGPDSITVERLRLYNVSYPVFLSGIARVKLPTEQMPRSVYCKSILGLVGGTTSEQAGMQAMVKAHMFGRFEPAIRQYLKLKAEQPQPIYKTLETQWRGFIKQLDIGNRNTIEIDNNEHGNDISPAAVITKECPSGFTEDPVVTYKSHAKGLAELCSGKLLYYLGDVDIVKRNLPPGCDHLELGQRTFTKEAYGIYFRKPPRTAYEDLDTDEQMDAVLYAEFNYLLVLQMQSAERLLENQYREEFGDAEMADDLQIFFKSMQYATDY